MASWYTLNTFNMITAQVVQKLYIERHVTGALYYQESTWPSSIHATDGDYKYQLVLQFTDSEH